MVFLGKKSRKNKIVWIEIFLCLIGCVAPVLFFVSEWVWYKVAIFYQIDLASLWVQVPLSVYLHFWIFVVGVLTGCEIPLLIEIGFRVCKKSLVTEILGVDYLFMFIGSIVFPFLIYEKLGLIAGGAFIASLNLVSIFILYAIDSSLCRKPFLVFVSFMFCGSFLLAYKEEWVRDLLLTLI